MKNRDEILNKVYKLLLAYKQGDLGGEKMPEDENPNLDKGSELNYMYFTLPMALNYQRNSYVLWENANRTYADKDTNKVFDSRLVCLMSEELLKDYLLKYKVALQPNKHPKIWRRLCETIEHKFNGDIRNLFIENDYSIKKIKEYIQRNKKDFPYLSGNKICNYWLYVIGQYTDIKFIDTEHITVAPDTHVIQASQKFGVITSDEAQSNNVQELVCGRWKDILEGTGIKPIDVHTPMWLWSRGKFKVNII